MTTENTKSINYTNVKSVVCTMSSTPFIHTLSMTPVVKGLTGVFNLVGSW